jgi:hypothetical protein
MAGVLKCLKIRPQAFSPSTHMYVLRRTLVAKAELYGTVVLHAGAKIRPVSLRDRTTYYHSSCIFISVSDPDPH